jgi:hypothetical protein
LLGGSTRDHAIRHLVRVFLVGVASLADAAFQLNAGTLLNNVGGFMGSGVEVRCPGERHMVPGGERFRTHRARTCRGRGIGVCLDAADVMASEGALKRVGEWHGMRAARDPVRGCRVNIGRLSRCGWHARSRNAWRRGELLHQGLLPRAGCHMRRCTAPRRGRCRR